MRNLVVGVALALLVGCACPPCEEPTPPGAPAVAREPRPEPANARLRHLVTFEMGPVVESLEGYAVLRAPDALRLYGMSETGQRAFDVAWVRSAGAARIVRIYRAPFLEDDRILDLIGGAAARIFLERPPAGTPFERVEGGWRRFHEGTEFFYAGPDMDLRWMRGAGFSACFLDWSDEGCRAPRRIHFHSDEGRHSYDLRLKLARGEPLPAPPPDRLFEARSP